MGQSRHHAANVQIFQISRLSLPNIETETFPCTIFYGRYRGVPSFPLSRSSIPSNIILLSLKAFQSATELGGYYIRLLDTAFSAYGDLLPECESRGVVWAGNKITYVASDAASASFQYEIRLDEVVAAELNGRTRAEGAIQLERPLREIYAGIYFPIPAPLESFLVPLGIAEIRLELHCEWFDIRTAKHWTQKEPLAT